MSRELCEQLWRSGPAIEEESLPILIKIARTDPSREVRWRAIEAIISAGRFSADALAAMKALAHDEDFYVRYHARIALREFGESGYVWTTIKDLLDDVRDAARWDAIYEVRSARHIPEEIQSALAYRLRSESDREIRAWIATALANVPVLLPQSGESLRQALHDSDESVRVRAATTLVRWGYNDGRIAEALLSGITNPSLAPPAWCALFDLSLSDTGHFISLLRSLDGSVVSNLMYEVLSRGIMPTIGMKRWNKGGQIRIPAYREEGEDKFPWDCFDVSHSWRSHNLSAGSKPLTDNQLCLYADWFPDLHLLAVTQLILYASSQWDPNIAPVVIEQNEVGHLLQGGGTVFVVDTMPPIQGLKKTDRIDFAYGFVKDARTVQYGIFAGMCKEDFYGRSLSRLEQTAGELWSEFRDKVRKILTAYGLAGLTHEQWYTEAGWRSLRYRIRYERPYAVLRPHLLKLAGLLGQGRAVELREQIQGAVRRFVEGVDNELRVSFLNSMPPRIRQVIGDMLI